MAKKARPAMGKKQKTRDAAERHAFINCVNVHEDSIAKKAFLAGVAWARRQAKTSQRKAGK